MTIFYKDLPSPQSFGKVSDNLQLSVSNDTPSHHISTVEEFRVSLTMALATYNQHKVRTSTFLY